MFRLKTVGAVSLSTVEEDVASICVARSSVVQ